MELVNYRKKVQEGRLQQYGHLIKRGQDYIQGEGKRGRAEGRSEGGWRVVKKIRKKRNVNGEKWRRWSETQTVNMSGQKAPLLFFRHARTSLLAAISSFTHIKKLKAKIVSLTN